MRVPPRAKKSNEILDEIEELLAYYLQGNEQMAKYRVSHFKYLRDYINEISREKKLNDIKLANKIKKDLSGK